MMEFRCLKCRQQKGVESAALVRMKTGRLGAKAQCPDCSTTMFRILGKDELEVEFQAAPPDRKLVRACSVLTREMADYLASHSWELYSIPHRYFEELVAEILASFGFEVHLNLRLLGMGRGDEADIIAFSRVRGMSSKIGYVIECKRFAQHRKVDLRIATRLYGLKERHAERWGLDRAILATTSTVTSEVTHEYGSRWDFEIRDHDGIVEWLKLYSQAADRVFLYDQGLYRSAAELLITTVKLLPNGG